MTRYAQLDGLRGLAALAVVAYHALDLGDTQLGFYAVRLFFALSGFLITGILLSARAQAALAGASRGGIWRAFVLRRTLRIFPVYYLALILFLVLGTPGLAENVWAALTYTTNVHFALDRHWHGAGRHLWTLAVEEQFYLVWPVVILYAPRRWLPAILIGCVLAAPAFRAAAYLKSENVLRATLLTPSLADSLVLGALFAWLHHTGSRHRHSLRWVCLTLGIPLAVIAESHPDRSLVAVTLRDAGAALCSAWLVVSASQGLPRPVGPLLESRPLVYLGTISYGVYLYHDYLIAGLGIPRGWHLFAVVLPLTLTLAAVSWRLLERPLNDLRHRWPYVMPPRSTDTVGQPCH